MKILNAARTGLSLLLCLLLLFLLSACSKGFDVEFGNGGDGVKKVDIKNETGSNVTELEITSDSDVTEISKSMIDSSSSWENGKTARVNCAEAGSVTILLTTNGKTYIMHNIDISGIEKATLKLDGDYAYLEFEKDGSQASTLNDEKAYVKAQEEKKEAEEKAKAEAEQKAKEEEAKKKAEEEAAEESAAAQAAQSQANAGAYSSVNDQPSSESTSSSDSSSSSQSSTSDSGSVEQSTDGCLPLLGN